ncbi:hypothetical protein JTB14_001414 [Gonioctena quinquepunctata]|nr:hypothetical protein JTB14_001414 [Gonioctena quinquepunctata]
MKPINDNRIPENVQPSKRYRKHEHSGKTNRRDHEQHGEINKGLAQDRKMENGLHETTKSTPTASHLTVMGHRNEIKLMRIYSKNIPYSLFFLESNQSIMQIPELQQEPPIEMFYTMVS